MDTGAFGVEACCRILFVDVSETSDIELRAIGSYETGARASPDPPSVEAVAAPARRWEAWWEAKRPKASA